MILTLKYGIIVNRSIFLVLKLNNIRKEYCILLYKNANMLIMNNKKPIVLRIFILALVAIMIVGLVIGTVVGLY